MHRPHIGMSVSCCQASWIGEAFPRHRRSGDRLLSVRTACGILAVCKLDDRRVPANAGPACDVPAVVAAARGSTAWVYLGNGGRTAAVAWSSPGPGRCARLCGRFLSAAGMLWSGYWCSMSSAVGTGVMTAKAYRRTCLRRRAELSVAVMSATSCTGSRRRPAGTVSYGPVR
jgi:hypothetical protein